MVRVVARSRVIFVDRSAVVLAVEIVFTVFNTVWPRGQHVSVAGRGQIVDPEWTEDFLAVEVEPADFRA